MFAIITATKEAAHIKALLKDEAEVIQEMSIGAITSLCFEVDVPFEISSEEEVRHVVKVLCRKRYREVPITSKEKVCTVGDFISGHAVYLARK